MADTMTERIRQILAAHGQLPVAVATLDPSTDLYAAGLKSFAVVQVMLALEAACDIEFPERMLSRRTFATIAAIEAAVGELMAEAAATA